ncbi:MAG TPA: isoprenylcysteine carboxylmethyltransferase family protein [Bryobacteraceae bacterium]|nr:isoprenylcysteine carboxylmethyltransferase family protein [Bryobacteraceae bacterium]HOQ45144.1 isoprenylcysteine carboxylmethyltransferase family protein [Bryobacteraceae bacterium]HPQ17632.1 isoprenylcysteine carboxylmethyltransferase family protein [Bryobacteraceae bacterium]HPU71216.1 isoprenylcysteine carboxylmethyltransferase family protein [Bryobacteraceae bacterium]
MRKRAAQLVFFLVLLACAYFVPAGGAGFAMAWALLGLYVFGMAVTTALLLARNPGLIAERAAMHAGAKRWDKPFAAILGLLGPAATWLVAGLDARFGWTPHFPREAQLATLVIAALGYALTSWAMVSNPFFSGFVRIQKERGHRVASGGPYRIVRHPGYVGILTLALATPFVLGSVWALIPAGLTAVAGVIRTALEDRTLRRELDGYEAYARAVRYRLVPGIW